MKQILFLMLNGKLLITNLIFFGFILSTISDAQIRSEESLKQAFGSRQIPSSAGFSDLIEACYNHVDNSTIVLMRVQGNGGAYHYALKVADELVAVMDSNAVAIDDLRRLLDERDAVMTDHLDTLIDQPFTQALYTKLLNIDEHANFTPIATHKRYGSVLLSEDFEFAESTQALKIRFGSDLIREFSADTAAGNWHKVPRDTDRWTRLLKPVSGGKDATVLQVLPYDPRNINDYIYSSMHVDSNQVILGQYKSLEKRGKENVLIGHRAGFGLDSTNSYNTIVGHRAAYSTGQPFSHNVMIGHYAGHHNIGGKNVIIGSGAVSGDHASTASSVIIGHNAAAEVAGANAVAVQNSIIIGESAGLSNGGDDNIIIGNRSAQSPNGDNGGNIIIGHAIDASFQKNTLIIGNENKQTITADLETGDVSIDRNLTVGGDVNITGSITATGSIPIGGIIMWCGTTTDIPVGWALCNGAYYHQLSSEERSVQPAEVSITLNDGQASNGWIKSPDLVDRFIKGGQPSGIRSTGGKKEVTLKKDNIPGHTHTVGRFDVSHNHKFSFTTDENQSSAIHKHEMEGYESRANNNDGAGPRRDVVRRGGTIETHEAKHSHSYTGYTFEQAKNSVNENLDHSHTMSDGSELGLNGESFEIVPEYYTLAFIMRIR